MNHVRIFETFQEVPSIENIFSKMKEYEQLKDKTKKIEKELEEADKENKAFIALIVEEMKEGNDKVINLDINTPFGVIYGVYQQPFNKDHTRGMFLSGINTIVLVKSTTGSFPKNEVLLWNLRINEYEAVAHLLKGLLEKFPEALKKIEKEKRIHRFDL